MDFEKTMNEAVDHHRAGRFREAAEVYRRVLAAQPGQPDALHLLGLATHRLGDGAGALELVQRAVAAQPGHPGYRFSEGNLLLGARRWADAERAFRAALASGGDDPAARSALAVAILEQGRSRDAEAELRAVIAAQPGFLPAHDNLTALLIKRGSFLAAETAARAALARAPDNPETLNNLASALIQTMRPAEAEPLLRKAIRLRRDFADAYYNLGLALLAQQKHNDADVPMRRAVQLEPDNVQYLIAAAGVVAELALVDEELGLAQRAYELAPDQPTAVLCLARAMHDRSEFEESERLMRSVLEREPTALLWAQLAHLHWEMGRLEEAKADCRQALALDPRMVNAQLTLMNCSRCSSLDDPDVKTIEALLAELEAADAAAPVAADGRTPNDESRMTLHFALGKAYDDAGEHVAGFNQYIKANDIKKRLMPPYEWTMEGRTVEEFSEVFTRERMVALGRHGSTSEVPVFIVGMPRSGTTLTEQIIASHPDAYGAGELLKMREVAARVGAASADRGGPEYPAAVLNLTPAEIAGFARLYLDHLYGHAGESKLRIVDKMPLNLRHVGLISVLFPRSRIVYCTRNPMDTCVSIFFQNFGRGHSFSNDTRNLGHFYALYQRLGAMWKERCPVPILEFPYEQVVEDPETWARRLIDFIGLPWDDRCLAFHKTDRAVRTASAWQVKQPIYKRSVARWKRYGKALDPLIEVLRAEGVDVDLS